MRGLLLTADLRGCRADTPSMTDLEALRRLCLDAVAASGLVAVGDRFHRFAPDPGPVAASAPGVEPPPEDAPAAATGITGVVLLAESHLAVHTWPELQATTLDVYVCNLGRDNSGRAEALMAALIAAFEPGSATRRSQRRG